MLKQKSFELKFAAEKIMQHMTGKNRDQIFQ